MKNYKKYLIAVAVLVVVFSIGRFSAPKQIETKEVEKIVYQQSETKDKNQDVTETTKETRLPDGTIITEKTKDKKTSTHSDTVTKENKETTISQTVSLRPEFRIGGIYEPAIVNFQSSSYTVMLAKRIAGEFYAGVSYGSHKTVGIVVSLGF